MTEEQEHEGYGIGIGSLNFDVESEFKPEPLIPNGIYNGTVSQFTFDSERSALVWQITLSGNDGVMSDGETPVDGSTVFFRNWLPRPGDENEYAKNGKGTKRQSKINMLKQFMSKMKIDISTPQKIAQAIEEQSFVGLEVKATIEITEYQGIVRNEVRKLERAAIAGNGSNNYNSNELPF